jgi:hypothetical protein
MQLLRLAILSLAGAALAFAADLDGKWAGEVNTNNGTMPISMAIKTAGESFTGTVSTQMGDQEIKEGKIKGDELTWVTTFEREGNTLKILNKAKVTGSEMKVNVTIEGP